MKLSALLAPLVAAKADHATIMDVVLAFEAEQTEERSAEAEQLIAAEEERKEKGRARWHKWRQSKAANVSQRLQPLANDSKRLAQADDAPDLENKQTNKQENKKTSRASHEAAFRAELADLPPELLDGIIQVRRDKRGQVTGLAARCFRDDAAECGMSVHDAAKACVTSSWITVKPHYFHGRTRQNGHSPPNGKRMNAVEAMLSLQAERENEQTSGTIDHRDDERFPSDQSGLPRLAGDFGQIVEWPVRQRDH